MGKYINKTSKGPMTSAFRKADALIEDGATLIGAFPPKEFKPNLVCVVDNGLFEAAGYASSPQEMKVFAEPDGRDKIWLEYPLAEQMAD